MARPLWFVPMDFLGVTMQQQTTNEHQWTLMRLAFEGFLFLYPVHYFVIPIESEQMLQQDCLHSCLFVCIRGGIE